jgi:hypothetical protein
VAATGCGLLRATGDAAAVGGALTELVVGSEDVVGGASVAGGTAAAGVVLAGGTTAGAGISRGRHAKNKLAAPSANPAAKLSSTLRRALVALGASVGSA